MVKRSRKTIQTVQPGRNWQQYQNRLKKESARKRSARRLPLYLLVLLFLAVFTRGAFFLLDWNMERTPLASERIACQGPQNLTQPLVRDLLANRALEKIVQASFSFRAGIHDLTARTSIHSGLQGMLNSRIDKKYARHFGLVAIEPESGRVVAMVNYDRQEPGKNVCTQPDFPAASLFKIVTAAAAIEECGFSDNTPVTYNGKKYSLYKSQLKPVNNRYTRHLSFAESFADSINPVFGKIGIHRLKKEGLDKYGEAFGFNHPIPFDLPLRKSPMVIKEEPYNWAEIACGFNRKTMISPLHAAVVAAAVANQGRLMCPTLIEAVYNDKKEALYQRKERSCRQTIDARTAEVLSSLMEATIKNGTARKAFRSARRDSCLAGLTIGGKTGSINNNPLHIKYDWFAGFAEEEKSSRKLAVAVLVAHKEYIGTRAAEYAEMAFKEYFTKNPTDSRI
jgi:cell division protein FtsI/penicillin-binding protein 2